MWSLSQAIKQIRVACSRLSRQLLDALGMQSARSGLPDGPHGRLLLAHTLRICQQGENPLIVV